MNNPVFSPASYRHSYVLVGRDGSNKHGVNGMPVPHGN
jgi:hypothetical protein